MGRQSYRQWGQVMVGVTGGLIALGVLVAMLGNSLPRSPLMLAWCLLGLAVSYAVFLRPCVVVDDDGVEVRNVLRDARIPWGVLRGARASWSLVVDAEETSHAAWAIAGAASPGRDALKRRELLTVGGGRESAGGSAIGSPAPGAELPAIGASATDIAAAIGERARLMAASGGRPADAARSVRRVVAWPPALLLSAACCLVVLVAVL